MDINQYYNDINNLSKKILSIINKQHIEGEETNLIRIIEDACYLVDEIVTDISLYNKSIKNYNNPLFYQGYFFFNNAIWRTVMTWERIINFLGMFYEIQYFEQSDKNKISYIYDKLKKNQDFRASNIFGVISKFISENSYKFALDTRKYNDHDICIHIQELENIEKYFSQNRMFKEIGDSYKLSQDKKRIECDLNVNDFEKINTQAHKMVYKKIDKYIDDIQKNIDVFMVLIDEITKLYYLNNKTILIQNINFKWSFKKRHTEKFIVRNKYFYNNMIDYIGELYNKSADLKGRHIKRANEINMNPALAFTRPPIIKTYNYFSDTAFRLHESIRSLLDSITLFHNQTHPIYPEVSVLNFMYITILRCYSCYDKMGKLIFIFFEVDDYNDEIDETPQLLFEKAITHAKNDETVNFIEPIKLASRILLSFEYERLSEIRNNIYHILSPHVVLSLENSSLLFSEFFYICFKNMDMILKLLLQIEIGVDKMHEVSKYINSSM